MVAVGVGVAIVVVAGAVFALTRGRAGTGSSEPLAVDFTIARANGIVDPNLIRVGQRLVIP